MFAGRWDPYPRRLLKKSFHRSSPWHRRSPVVEILRECPFAAGFAVRISTLPDNEAALKLYRESGFEERGVEAGEVALYKTL